MKNHTYVHRNPFHPRQDVNLHHRHSETFPLLDVSPVVHFLGPPSLLFLVKDTVELMHVYLSLMMSEMLTQPAFIVGGRE